METFSISQLKEIYNYIKPFELYQNEIKQRVNTEWAKKVGYDEKEYLRAAILEYFQSVKELKDRYMSPLINFDYKHYKPICKTAYIEYQKIRNDGFYYVYQIANGNDTYNVKEKQLSIPNSNTNPQQINENDTVISNNAPQEIDATNEKKKDVIIIGDNDIDTDHDNINGFGF